jgi:RNA polymerase sigma factor (sigma-70 family)
MMHDDDGEVWDKHSAELIRFATTLVGPADAEDLLSMAFLAAVSSPSWPTVTNRRAYLFRAVANHAHRHRRSYRRRLEREIRAASALPPHEPSTSDLDVLIALQRLTVRRRATIWLAYWLDLTPAEIAVTLSVSQRSVERDLQSSRRQLKRILS